MKITVLLGGTSAERDVSIASGLRIIDALRSRGHDVTALDPADDVSSDRLEAKLRKKKMEVTPPSLEELRSVTEHGFNPLLGTLPVVLEADVVFLALHGGMGEDGTVQAMLEAANVAYTGSGHLASALAMDKDLSKLLFRAAGVGTADWLMATSRRPAPPAAEVASRLGLPVVVKPSKQGSTVGLSVVKRAQDLAAAVEEAFRYDDEVMLESFVPGRELTVGILGEKALPVGEIIPKHEIYDYECKYTPGMAREEFPARLAPDVAARVQDEARRAFDALKLSGYARIDFRLTDSGDSFCLEANTLPGMTELSLIPQAAQAAGIGFADLCERIATLGRERGRG